MLMMKRKLLVFCLLVAAFLPLHADNLTEQFTYSKKYMPIFIESVAKSKLGKKYKWGGNGPYQYDCSGFTKEVFAKSGIKIPRVSREQAKVGRKISKHQLRKGDLIFFHSKKSKVVDHVGIYLGQGKFIHASRFHKRIVISPLREYRRYFSWGRRLLG